jgi:hypothetical protein
MSYVFTHLIRPSLPTTKTARSEKPSFCLKTPVLLGDLAVRMEIAQQIERDRAKRLRPGRLRRLRIDADPQQHRIVLSRAAAGSIRSRSSAWRQTGVNASG